MLVPIKLIDFLSYSLGKNKPFTIKLIRESLENFPWINKIFIYNYDFIEKNDYEKGIILIGVLSSKLNINKENIFLSIIIDGIEDGIVLANIEYKFFKNIKKSEFRIYNINISLLFENLLLKSVDEKNKPIDEPFTISSEVEISIDTDLNFSFNFLKDLSTKFAISDTGFIVEIQDLNFDFPKGKSDLTLKKASIIPPQFLLPKKDDTDSNTIVLPTLNLFDAIINDKGFSGIVSVNWNLQYKEQEKNSETKPFYYYNINKEKSIEEQPLADFLGISGGFEYISLTFIDNELVDSKIVGKLLIPYFDEPIDIELNIITGNDKLDFTITLKSEKQKGIELKKEELIALYMKSLSISKEGNSVALTVDGGLQPLLWNIDGLEWPRLDVEGLGIEQDFTLIGEKLKAPQIKFKEAWVDLKELATLDLFGFHFELNKIGMGYIEAEEIGKSDQMWLEFTGSLKLIELLPMGVAVEGFRLTWDVDLYEGVRSINSLIEASSKIEVKFDGVRIAHSIPHTLGFDGFIKFIKEEQNIGFAGGVELQVPSTGLAIESNLLIGINSQTVAFPYLYIQFGIQLPSGIPLAQSGLALKGAEGLLGMNVEPAIQEGKSYYDWYKSEPEGITSALKWRDKRMSFAFGAGVTITTIDGKAFGVQGLLALVIPGPIILLEGKALIFDGIFPKNGAPKALAFFNGNDNTVQFNIETSMVFGGGVVDVNANIEAFVDFKKYSNWHIYIGKDKPIERRLHANILKIPKMGWLFEGNSYLMLSQNGANMGMTIGFEPPKKDLKVVSVKMKAILDGDGKLNTNPFQFNGKIDLDALLEVKAFDILDLSVSALAEVTVKGSTPLTVDASLKCNVDLPVPNLEEIPVVNNLISWFEENVTDIPKIPSHIKFIVPFHWEYDENPTISPLIQGMSLENSSQVGGTSIFNQPSGKSSPIVPLDSKPVINFDQDMNQEDNIYFGGVVNNGNYIFSSGEKEFKSTIKEIKLYKVAKDDFSGNNWGEPISIANSKNGGNEFWGMFRPEPNTPSRKILQLWSSNPFEFLNGTIPINLGAGYAELASYSEHFLTKDKPLFTPLEKKEKECFQSIRSIQTKIIKRDREYYKQIIINGVIFEGTNISFDEKKGDIFVTKRDEKEPSLSITFIETIITINVSINFTKKDKENNPIKDERAFNKIEFSSIDKFNIQDICWITESSENKAKYLKKLKEINDININKFENKVLSFDSYYKLEINYNIKSVKDNDIFNYKNSANIKTKDCKEIGYFQTEGSPKNLRPYIAYIYPIHEDKTFFYKDDIIVHFNRSYMKKLYPTNTPYSLKLVIENSEGTEVINYKTRWGKDSKTTLMKEEDKWYDYINKDKNALSKDDTIVFTKLGANALKAKSRYNLFIKMEDDTVVYSSRFMTSEFGLYQELLDSYNKHLLELKVTEEIDNDLWNNLFESQKKVKQARDEYAIKKDEFNKKNIHQELVEISKQIMITQIAQHDEKFFSLLLKFENIAYEILSKRLKAYKIIYNDEIIGLLLRSPESLNSHQKQNKIKYISNGDGTTLFIEKSEIENFIYRNEATRLEKFLQKNIKLL